MLLYHRPQGRWKLAALGVGSFRLPRGLLALSQRRGRKEEVPSPSPSLRRGSTLGSEMGSVWGSDFPEVEARERREEEEEGRPLPPPPSPDLHLFHPPYCGPLVNVP